MRDEAPDGSSLVEGLVPGWAILGSNQRPLPCQGSALPLRQSPSVLLEVATGFEPVCTALQAAASPLGHATSEAFRATWWWCLRADDGTRTRDPHLGKVMRYQLRYIRVAAFQPRVRL